MKDKSIFKLEELPVQRYAEALGLPGAPKIKFLNKEIAKAKKNASHAVANAGTVSQLNKPDESYDESESNDESGESSGEEDETSKAEASTKPEKVRLVKVSTTFTY